MNVRILLFLAGLAALAGIVFGPEALAQAGAEVADEITEAATQSDIVITEADVPDPTGTGLRVAATPVAEEVHAFYEYILLPMKLLISFFVLALIVWVVVRYNRHANPVPKKFSHNTAVEVAWTLVPVLILLVIAVPSFDLLYLEDTMPDGRRVQYQGGTDTFTFENDFAESRLIQANRHLEVAVIDAASGDRRLLELDDYSVEGFGEEALTIRLAQPLPASQRLEVVGGRSRVGAKPILGLFGVDRSRIVPAPTLTIKAVGYQWGWAYSYPDFGDFEFDALMAPADTVPSELYRFATTNDIVVPAGETVRVITTGRDVIHSWAMPAFGVKIDAIPGRLNETWFYTEKESTFYGQCSEICGKDHAFMPISVRVVPRPEFEAWVNEQRALAGLEPLIFDEPEQVAALSGGSAELN
jgi:heme/copper-type cytochrome/quinol oxidase subunit 2